MKKVLKILTIVFSVAIIMVSCFSFLASAAGTTISISNQNPEVNQTISVTVTINPGVKMYGTSGILNYDPSVLRFDSGDNASGGAGSVKLTASSSGATKQSYTLNFTAIGVGNSSVSATDCMYAIDSEESISGASAPVTVKNSSGNASNASQPDTAASTATLKSLTLSSGSLSPKFSASKTTYAVSVPFSVTQCKIYATATDLKAKVDVSGNANLSVGQTTRTVTVTAQDGTQKVYTINITRLAEGEEVNASSEEAPVAEGNPYEVVVGDTAFTVLTDLSGIALPNSFSAGTTDYNGNPVAIAVDENSYYKIYYLKSADSDTPTPYILDQKSQKFEKLKYVSLGDNTYIFATYPSIYKAGDDYYSTNAEIGGFTVSCFESKKDGMDGLYYVYCYSGGKYNMYRYDSLDNVMQRAPEFEMIPADDISNLKSSGFIGRFNDLSTNGKVIVLCLLIGIIGAIVLIVLFAIKLIQRNKSSRLNDGNDFNTSFDNISSNNPFLMTQNDEADREVFSDDSKNSFDDDLTNK